MKHIRLIVSCIFLFVTLSGCAKSGAMIADESSDELTLIPIESTFWYRHSLYTGTGYFKFAIMSPFGTTWTNDGETPPVMSLPLEVTNGHFFVNLGDTHLKGMNESLSTEDFPFTTAFVQTWFSPDEETWEQLPDKKIKSPFPYDEIFLDELWNSKESDFPVGHTFIHEEIKTSTLHINEDGTYTIYRPDMHQQMTDAYNLDGNLYIDYFERSSCQGMPPGTYEWMYIGNWLTFRLVGEDRCTIRREDLENKIWMQID